MIDRLLDIAPALTWARVGVAASLLLVGFVALSHTLVHVQARRTSFGGWLGAGWVERTLRWGVAALGLGFGLFVWEVGAPLWSILLLMLVGLSALGAEAVALART